MTTTMMKADDLGVPEAWRTALVLVLAKLERGELKHYTTEENALWVTPRPTGDNNFSMNWWDTRALAEMMDDQNENCGSCCCIGGWAERLGGVKFSVGLVDLVVTHPALENLFYPPPSNITRIAHNYDSITVEEAAQALRNYLEGGHARWDDVL